MRNGLPRYYKSWTTDAGANYYIFDRLTGDKVHSCFQLEEAENKVRDLNKKDRDERGLPPINAIETPASYYGVRNRNDQEIAPMPIHK